MNISDLVSCYENDFGEFPHWPFGPQSNYGDAFIAFIIVLLLFDCMAVICDSYFLPSIEKCSQVLNLSEDIAGVTLMAAGSSAPEFFINIIGAIINKYNVGLGTVIGSGIFNTVVVIGLCSLLSSGVKLQRWPLFRDSIIYSVNLCILFAITIDGVIKSYEAVILLCFYSINVLVLYFNKNITEFIESHLPSFRNHKLCEREEYLPITGKTAPNFTFQDICAILILRNRKLFSLRTVFRSSVKCVLIQKRKIVDFSKIKLKEKSILSEWTSRILNIFHRPMIYFLSLTMPDPSGTFFVISLIISIAWLGLISYITFWMVQLIGFVLRISSSFMGLIVLSIGASIQDTYSSVKVAKEGQGNMALSNSLGSNILNIELCLSVPWFIKTVIFRTPIITGDQNLVPCVGILFVAIWITVFALKCSNWRLNKGVGYSLIFYYILFVIIVILLYSRYDNFCLIK